MKRILTAAILTTAIGLPLAAQSASTPDAIAATSLNAPLAQTRKSGTISAFITAVIRQSVSVEYTASTGTGGSGMTAASGNGPGRKPVSALTAVVQIQGMPNQTFAVSLHSAGNWEGGRISHDAGPTPHLGPDGGGTFGIDARVNPNRVAAFGGQRGSLDVIVSHN